MANIDKTKIGYNEIASAGTANAWLIQHHRRYGAPMDISEVFTSFEAAQNYASTDIIAYAGQTIAVAGEGIKTEVYKITSGGTLVRLVDENDIKNLSGGTNNITIVTSDWSATEGKEGHILNRTHYKDVEILENGGLKTNDDGEPISPHYIRFRNEYGNLSDLILVDDYTDGSYIEGNPLYDEYGDTVEYIYGTLIFQPYNWTIEFTPEGDGIYYVDSVYESLKQLDEEFIPDTIARAEQLTELHEEIAKKADKENIYYFEFDGTDKPVSDYLTEEEIEKIANADKVVLYSPQDGGLVYPVVCGVQEALITFSYSVGSMLFVLMIYTNERRYEILPFPSYNDTEVKTELARLEREKADKSKLTELSEEVNKNPFEKGESENSAVLKGGNNQVISEGGVALGKDNFVGLKGWYINDIYTSDGGKNYNMTISSKNTELGDLVKDSDFNCTYEEGDIISIQIGSIFTNIGRIEIIQENDYGHHIIFSSLKYFSLPQSDPEKRYYLWVLSKPNAGVVDLGQNAISYGLNNQSLSECAYAEGKNNKAFGKYAHVEGKENEAHYCSHAEGSNNIALGNTSHAEGTDNRALNSNTHVEGRYTSARGYASHAEGYGESVEVSTEASGEGAHAEGRVTKAQGNYSHTEGQYTSAVGIASHAEGKGESVDNPNLASGNYSHVEGEKTKATNIAAHAEGIITTSSGKAAHAEGRETQALADYSHAEGYLSSVVSGAIGGHSEGVYNIVNNSAEHASGKYNVSIPKTADNTTADATHFSIGIGTSDTDRKNAFEVKQNGDVYIEGVEGRIQDKLNKISEINQIIEENERVCADSISELNNRINNINTKTVLASTNEKCYLIGYSSKEGNTQTLNTSSTDVYMENGELFAVSDETLKDFGSDIDIDLNKLAELPKVYYSLKNDADKKQMIGTSAQKLREIYPELVSEDANGKLAVSYEKLSIVALAAIDKLNKKHEEKLAQLESELDKIKKELNII